MAKSLALVEAEVEKAEERADLAESRANDLEEELKGFVHIDSYMHDSYFITHLSNYES